MTAPTILEWSDLTDEQRAAMMTVPGRTTDVQCWLLNFADLSEVTDISDSVDPTQGDIQWDSTRIAFRDIDIFLSLDAPITDELTLIKVYKVYTNPQTGITARRARGVFVLTKPDNPVSAKVLNPASRLFDRTAYSITGQDMMCLLDRNVPYSLSYDVGAGTLDSIRDVYARAGLPDATYALIDTSRDDAVLTEALVFPLVAATTDASDSGSTTPASSVTSAGDPTLARSDDTTSQATWVTVLDALHKQINYRAVYADENGLFRNVPYVDPALAASEYTFDADDPTSSTVAMNDRNVSDNLVGIPNQWVGIWDNQGDGITPTPDNGGIVTIDNLTDGPTSQQAKYGLVFPTIVHFTAVSADDFAVQLNGRVASDKRQVTTYTYSTRQYPDAGHFNVITLQDSAVQPAAVKLQASQWQEPMDSGDTTWTWVSI